jgi:hypothetical protein
MKLTSIEVHPDGSSSVLTMSFRDPTAVNPFNVETVTGLDAEEIIPKYYATVGSSKFYDMALSKRQIVMVAKLNPNFTNGDTFASLRDTVYKTISSSRTGKVQLQFKNGTTVVAVSSGFVSKVEAPQFEKKQEIKITVDCDKGILEALVATAVPVAGLSPAGFVITDNLSTAPHGFSLDATVLTAVASLVISDPNNPGWTYTVTPSGGFLVGDVLHFSSIYGNKYINLTRGASTIQLGEVLGAGSVWPILFPGDNHFQFSNPANWTLTAISHSVTYWGV